MISLFFVGDGDRDDVTVPRLVEGILSIRIEETTKHWKQIRAAGGKGYARTLKYAVRQAKDAGCLGIVATVDVDKDRDNHKIKTLREARQEELAREIYPIAIGAADPHGEAWLLDDSVAVRDGLSLDGSVEIPTVRKVKSPKEAIEKLKDESGTELGICLVLDGIAQRVDVNRCMHKNETGFHVFEENVRSEFRSVKNNCGDDCKCGGC